jgi:hypothetical protein
VGILAGVKLEERFRGSKVKGSEVSNLPLNLTLNLISLSGMGLRLDED